jgi:probable F420-dependent oxidoreductase
MSLPQPVSSDPAAKHGVPGKVAVWSMELRFGDQSKVAEVLAELEELGFGTLWIPGGVGGDFMNDVTRLLAATKRLVIATGILNIYKHEPADVGAWWHDLAEAQRARLMLGLGVSHGPLIGEGYGHPLKAMSRYLDDLDAVKIPKEKRCIAALGPKMLELARQRTAGSHPYLVTAEHTARAREILGTEALLAPELGVIFETDPAKARALARGALSIYLRLPNYLNNWRRLGFSEEDVTQATDRLVDGLFAWGTEQKIAARINEHLQAGADQVCVQVIHGDAATMRSPREAWRTLASMLV